MLTWVSTVACRLAPSIGVPLRWTCLTSMFVARTSEATSSTGSVNLPISRLLVPPTTFIYLLNNHISSNRLQMIVQSNSHYSVIDSIWKVLIWFVFIKSSKSKRLAFKSRCNDGNIVESSTLNSITKNKTRNSLIDHKVVGSPSPFCLIKYSKSLHFPGPFILWRERDSSGFVWIQRSGKNRWWLD